MGTIDFYIYLTFIILSAAAGVALGYLLRNLLGKARVESAEATARRLVQEAEKQASAAKKEALLEAKDEIYNLRTEAEREIRERRAELQRLESKLLQREELLEERSIKLEQKEKQISSQEKESARIQAELSEVLRKERLKLEAIADLSAAEAKALLMKRLEEEARYESAKKIREIELEASEEAEKRAKKIISLAIQRCASNHVAETTVSVVSLPSDEMKGRIIGREGRNIRAFENLTGINLIIDDTPEAVILSSFDPIRRETARVTLENLIADGRIQPARIEEMFGRATAEVNEQIKQEGERAIFETGVSGLPNELIKVLGRLRFRSSYGQNVLQHSIETAHLAGIMAAELGLGIKKAKRAGLLHDIGKAIDHEVEGAHAIIGADLARRLNEPEDICHAIESHHNDREPQSILAVLIQAADAISGARPGARRENLESYVKRLENIERIANEFKGVEKSFAMQAGREVRVVVQPEIIDDVQSARIARELAKKIEEELEYAGQIKVTVIRETRAIEYAR
nr:ribonuclease Y [Candidatus Hakubella thermalkaliphila]